ncbi:unnamed protein product, partial [marine sediment metagenome]
HSPPDPDVVEAMLTLGGPASRKAAAFYSRCVAPTRARRLSAQQTADEIDFLADPRPPI